MSFLTVCLNPTLQKTLRFSSIISGTVNRMGTHRLDVSGKGINVTRVLTQLGKKAVHLTQLGGVMRPLFLSLCEQDRLSVEWVESGSQIRFCYTLLTESDNGVTELVEESEPVGAGTEERLLEKFDSLLREAPLVIKYLVVSGTKAAGFSDAVIPLMVRKAKEKGLKVILDLKGKDLIESLQYGPDIVKPNLFEFAGTFAPELVKDNDFSASSADAAADADAAQDRIKYAALDIARKYGCRVILTNGSKRIAAVDGDGEKFFETDIQAVKPVSTIGSGDAFTAGLAAALDDGADFRGAIAEGIRCGALNAGQDKPGVILPEGEWRR
jgi:fructose-1-phosphate kinase PfkB-like protein